MIDLTDLAYVRIGTRDLATQLDFVQDVVGLELVGQEGDTAMLRADDRHHCVAFVEGDHAGTLSSGFVLAEFGHLGIEAPDVVEAHDFWTRHFNIKVSDWIGENAALMRFDPVHHKPAIFKDTTGLGHVNFQVDSIDDVMRSWRFLEANEVPILMGPGRHPQSTAIFLYFTGPEGVTWEYSHGVRLIPEDQRWTPRQFDTAEPDFIDMWRGAIPAARREARVS